MIVTELQIRNFRNYPQAKLTLSPGINLISGDNAQGKTNLLESLVYLSLTRSWRTNEDRLLIRNVDEKLAGKLWDTMTICQQRAAEIAFKDGYRMGYRLRDEMEGRS